ncbi:nitrous oxide reductase accessory protein NosL [Halomonas sp. V046]|uniref:nitrous oxide reductase accessory protein NosL n=1 Tax=Halomonas sp. V046 TaxID=3459611 RepID=UPI004044B75A
MMPNRLKPLASLALAAALLAGCDASSSPAALAGPEPITDADICHVCGMLVANQPGPKGEVYLNHDQQARKFCSTLEMFIFLRQPDNAAQLSHAWVHDMGHTDWDHPANDAFTRARDAWYVVGHRRRGSMGHTLASFATRADAETFQRTYAGDLKRFDDIQLATLTALMHEPRPHNSK